MSSATRNTAITVPRRAQYETREVNAAAVLLAMIVDDVFDILEIGVQSDELGLQLGNVVECADACDSASDHAVLRLGDRLDVEFARECGLDALDASIIETHARRAIERPTRGARTDAELLPGPVFRECDGYPIRLRRAAQGVCEPVHLVDRQSPL